MGGVPRWSSWWDETVVGGTMVLAMMRWGGESKRSGLGCTGRSLPYGARRYFVIFC